MGESTAAIVTQGMIEGNLRKPDGLRSLGWLEAANVGVRYTNLSRVRILGKFVL
jgi:hypothetical protein